MHDCEECGSACGCDGEDTYFDEAPDDCSCEHEAMGDEDDFEDLA